MLMGQAMMEEWSADSIDLGTANGILREAVRGGVDSWVDVHRNLCGIAMRRAELDANEACWLRAAERLKIWRELGMVSAIDYMERALGYEPRTAQDRLRVARALGELPLLAEGLQRNQFHFSAIKELTRVATPETERTWYERALGKNVKQVQQMVSGHRLGSLPDDPVEPDLQPLVVRYEILPGTFARLRQAHQLLDTEHGRHLDDDDLIAALCDAVLDGTSAECDGRPRAQIALTVCERCDQGWQHGSGALIAVDAGTVDRARCNAQDAGSLDADSPTDLTRDISAKVVRFVWHRDHGCCQTPGCRSARGLEIHHIVRRVDGGSHEASNLTLRCGACHHAIHNGKLTVTGTAPDHIVVVRTGEAQCSPHTTAAATTATTAKAPRDSMTSPTPDIPASAGCKAPPAVTRPSSKLEAATAVAQVRDALVKLGWTSAIAREAAQKARAHVGADAEVECLLREAVRRCRPPA